MIQPYIELLFHSPIAIMTINTTQWDSAEYLKTEEDMLLYLEACLEEAGEDLAFIAHALGVSIGQDGGTPMA